MFKFITKTAQSTHEVCIFILSTDGSNIFSSNGWIWCEDWISVVVFASWKQANAPALGHHTTWVTPNISLPSVSPQTLNRIMSSKQGEQKGSGVEGVGAVLGVSDFNRGAGKRGGVSTATEWSCLSHMTWGSIETQWEEAWSSAFSSCFGSQWEKHEWSRTGQSNGRCQPRSKWNASFGTTWPRDELSSFGCVLLLYQLHCFHFAVLSPLSFRVFSKWNCCVFSSTQSSKCLTLSSLPWPCVSSPSLACTASLSATAAAGENQVSYKL